MPNWERVFRGGLGSNGLWTLHKFSAPNIKTLVVLAIPRDKGEWKDFSWCKENRLTLHIVHMSETNDRLALLNLHWSAKPIGLFFNIIVSKIGIKKFIFYAYKHRTTKKKKALHKSNTYKIFRYSLMVKPLVI